MMKLTPAARLSLGLATITLSIIVAAQGLGLTPNLKKEYLRSREQLAQSLAQQATLAVKHNDQALLRNGFNAAVEQNTNILSIGLQKKNGARIYESLLHSHHWKLPIGAPSSAEFMRLPITIDNEQKGSLEITFVPITSEEKHLFGTRHFLWLTAFVCLSGFTAFWFYIKRALQQLAPSAVMPTPVRNALNVMAEGVMILDRREQVVLANETMTVLLNQTENKLIGRAAGDLGFEPEINQDAAPWTQVQATGKKQVGVRMTYQTEAGVRLAFRVNAIPIKDRKGNNQGVIASLDNITELEEKSNLLKQMIKNLAEKQQAIESKNQELHHLASRDPLTNCFNRRTLFDFLNGYFEKSDTGNHEELCLIMGDIDHFKNINDTYGHNFGDEAIQSVATTLKAQTREGDIVARFGGEEFCILLPNTEIETACSIADACRNAIAEKRIKEVTITSSFGVTSIKSGAKTPNDLIHLANQALYKSKEDGRNRCTMWSSFLNKAKHNNVS